MAFGAVGIQNVKGHGRIVSKEGTVRFVLDVTRFENTSATGTFAFAPPSGSILGMTNFESLEITGAKFPGKGQAYFEGIGVATFANGTQHKLIYNVDVFDNGGADVISVNFPEMPAKKHSFTGPVQNGNTTITTL